MEISAVNRLYCRFSRIFLQRNPRHRAAEKECFATFSESYSELSFEFRVNLIESVCSSRSDGFHSPFKSSINSAPSHICCMLQTERKTSLRDIRKEAFFIGHFHSFSSSYCKWSCLRKEYPYSGRQRKIRFFLLCR